MPKMSIDEAAKYFGVSKEAIHNRVRRGSLESVVEDGVKFVKIEKKPLRTPRKSTVSKSSNSISDDKYYSLLQEQNNKLQARVEVLEAETRTLRDQKEQILIAEREKIEQIYKQKDEQLKNILNVISSKFMLNAPLQPEEEQQEEHVEAEIEVTEEEKPTEVISLKKYLKKEKFSDKKSTKIKNRFKKRAKKDERIIIVGKKYYVDVSRYDYGDLLH